MFRSYWVAVRCGGQSCQCDVRLLLGNEEISICLHFPECLGANRRLGTSGNVNEKWPHLACRRWPHPWCGVGWSVVGDRPGSSTAWGTLLLREWVARRRSESLLVSTMRASGGQPVDIAAARRGSVNLWPHSPGRRVGGNRDPGALLVFGQDLQAAAQPLGCPGVEVAELVETQQVAWGRSGPPRRDRMGSPAATGQLAGQRGGGGVTDPAAALAGDPRPAQSAGGRCRCRSRRAAPRDGRRRRTCRRAARRRWSGERRAPRCSQESTLPLGGGERAWCNRRARRR